jgi:AraC-like DNA-binding protein/phage anti-repressor protein
MTLHVSDRLRPAIHPTYARLLCAWLRQQGHDTADIFRDTRLQWEQLLGDNRFISLEQMSRLIRRAIRLTGKPWAGLEVGDMTMVSAHGPVGYAAVAARDVRQVLEVATRFSSLRLQIMEYFFEETDGECRLGAREFLDFGDAREYILSTNLATFLRLIQTVSAEQLHDLRVELPFPEPAWADQYHQKLGCPVTFGAEAYRLIFPASLLDVPCLTADPVAFRTALRECENQLRQLESGGAMSQRIRNELLNCDGQYPTLDDMADAFAMSRRTLIRKLKAEDTSYQDLLDDVRQELAAWYLLNTDMPVETIAEKLGYQDTSNFSRTFRRWFGQTPRQMRTEASG